MKLKIIIVSIYGVTTATALHLNKKYDELEKWATNQQIGSPYDALHFKETVKAKENFVNVFKHTKSSQDIINISHKLLSDIILNLQAPKESKEYIGIKDLDYKAYLKRYYAKVQAIMIRDRATKAAKKLMREEGKAPSNDLLAQEIYTKTVKEVEKKNP
ncbi:hypothetical protein L0F63_006888 [Massospora cicadina]|nr:hypothetical protein L0F63_006888 [Massospora cicadina]